MAGINDGHRERLKARFLREGLDHFEPHNILELLLFYAIPQKDTNPLAHQLLDTFGSLAGVLRAPYEALCRVPGVGSHTATLLKLSEAMVRPYLEDSFGDGQILDSSEKLCRFLQPKFAGRKVETVVLVCMDIKKKVLYSGVVEEGSMTAVQFTVKKIAEKAMGLHASFVALAHNHPDGFAFPSQEDILSTHAIQRALLPLDIRVVDHVVVARDDSVSIADSGGMLKL